MRKTLIAKTEKKYIFFLCFYYFFKIQKNKNKKNCNFFYCSNYYFNFSLILIFNYYFISAISKNIQKNVEF